MCRLLFSIDNNHQFAAASIAKRRLLRQANDCIAVLPDGTSGGLKGETNFIIIELPGVTVSEMRFLVIPVMTIVITPGAPDVQRPIARREKTVDLSALRLAMSLDDQKKFDRHPDFPVDPRTGLRPCPQLSKAAVEVQVGDRP